MCCDAEFGGYKIASGPLKSLSIIITKCLAVQCYISASQLAEHICTTVEPLYNEVSKISTSLRYIEISLDQNLPFFRETAVAT